MDRSRPLLLLSYSGTDKLAVSLNGEEPHQFEIKDDLTRTLEAFVLAQANSHARRADARPLLSPAEAKQGYVCDSGRDILLWPCKDEVCIRHEGKTNAVRTWGLLSLWQLMPDGTIWVGEKVHLGGIAVLDTEGRFLGWRAKGFGFTFYSTAAEADKSVMPLVEKLLARPKDRDSKGF